MAVATVKNKLITLPLRRVNHQITNSVEAKCEKRKILNSYALAFSVRHNFRCIVCSRKNMREKNSTTRLERCQVAGEDISLYKFCAIKDQTEVFYIFYTPRNNLNRFVPFTELLYSIQRFYFRYSNFIWISHQVIIFDNINDFLRDSSSNQHKLTLFFGRFSKLIPSVTEVHLSWNKMALNREDEHIINAMNIILKFILRKLFVQQ